jgi:hypothetical protein
LALITQREVVLARIQTTLVGLEGQVLVVKAQGLKETQQAEPLIVALEAVAADAAAAVHLDTVALVVLVFVLSDMI